jgi:hypothetical protein
MPLPQDIPQLLDTLLARLQHELGDQLIGLYLRGSLALGDFIPATSDVDVLAVLEHAVSPTLFARLTDLHADLAGSANPYATRMEMVYLDRGAVRHFTPGQQHPTLGQGGRLHWEEHRANWIFERWTVREHGVILFGPDPRTLIDPIGKDELRAAARGRLSDWAAWAAAPEDPEFLLPRAHQAYISETICRALATVASGELWSKPRSVAWALAQLPEPWRTTVRDAQAGRTDRTDDPAKVDDIVQFVQWAAGDSSSCQSEPTP